MSDRGPTALLLTFARRGEEEEIRRALASLAGEFAGLRSMAVGTPASAPVLRDLGVEQVVIYGEGRGARETMREAKAHGPEIAAVIYCGPGTKGHLKLEALAVSIPTRHIYRFVPGAPARSIGRPALSISVAGKALLVAGSLAVGATVCAVAFCWLRMAQLVGGGWRARRP